jgi:hypothetical protein
MSNIIKNPVKGKRSSRLLHNTNPANESIEEIQNVLNEVFDRTETGKVDTSVSVINMEVTPNSSAPLAPDENKIKVYSQKAAGRDLPRWQSNSGVPVFFQPALFGNNVQLYMPNTGTTAGLALGTPWAVGTTIGHPAPTSTSAYTQMKRTTSTNVATTQNQVLGVSSIVATAPAFWRGNAAGLGGFFFFARFGLELVPANTTRLFVGLHSGTTSMVASDTVPAISCVGLWHDTTDGANVINIVMRNGTDAAVKVPLAGSPVTPYTAGQGYDFYLYARPNCNCITYRLDNLNTGAILSEGTLTGTNLPLNTTFMGPAVQMSNGTANTTVSTTAIGVNRIYVESDR